MSDPYIHLVTKEEMWAKMLLEVLEDNGIPATSLPVHGAGLVLKGGVQEELMIYVPSAYLPRANALLEELFSEDSILEE